MSPTPEVVSRHPASGRDLYLVRVPDASAARTVATPEGHFTCLLVWDAAGESVDALAGVAEHLLEAGCVYVCNWGEDCERVSDVIFETIVGDGSSLEPEGRLVMTTWHPDESLDDVTCFWFECANPDDGFVDTCRSSLVLVVGGDEARHASLRSALSDPVEFCRRVVEDENSPTSREARWSDRPRTCPRCGASFVSVQDLGTCPACLLAFRASDTEPGGAWASQ